MQLLRGVTSQLHGTIGSQNWEDRKNKACEATAGVRNLAQSAPVRLDVDAVQSETSHRYRRSTRGFQYLCMASLKLLSCCTGKKS